MLPLYCGTFLAISSTITHDWLTEGPVKRWNWLLIKSKIKNGLVQIRGILIQTKKDELRSNVHCVWTKTASCSSTCSKADDQSYIFFFQHLIYDHGKVFKIELKEYVFLLVRRQKYEISVCVLAIFSAQTNIAS